MRSLEESNKTNIIQMGRSFIIIMLIFARNHIPSPFVNKLHKILFPSSTNNHRTIYALSSGLHSAISIVRITGPTSYHLLSLIDRSPSAAPFAPKQHLLTRFNVRPREMSLRSIFGRSRGLIDRCMLVYFEAGRSYSGEDLFQLHLHGSRAVLVAVFDELSQLGFVPAKRGELTRRAIQNGRMTLGEAEAVDDLVHSELEFERQVAIGNLMGRGGKYLQQLRSDLVGVRSIVQSYIQFEEQEVGKDLHVRALSKAGQISSNIKGVVEGSKMLQRARDGVKVAIVGRPNVGKSTLINGLCQKQVAIVSEIAGTTRDLIQSSFQVGGYRIDLVDTAGLRDSACPIEQEGMRRARTSMQESQITMIVIDVSQSTIKIQQGDSTISVVPHEEEVKMIKQNMDKMLLIANKIDTLPPQHAAKQMKVMIQNERISPHLCISANQQQSIKQLTSHLGTLINQRYNLYGSNSSQLYFTRSRYIIALEQCMQDLQKFIHEPYADLGSYHLSNAISRVQEVIGRVDNEELLDQIFSTFCIGK